jgi:hypothetical protein
MKVFYPTAKVIADSISPTGDRLVTLEVEMHRYVLSEFNTHRAFSRNSASSRAIPYAKMRAKALDNPALPLSWPKEQSGMQGGEELPEIDQITSEFHWLEARDSAVHAADKLHRIGVHKSVINRLLEPFISHTVIVSGTYWDGFWAQRCHSDAQPEIRAVAEEMFAAFEDSKPQELYWGEWHLPYISETEREEFGVEVAKKVSAARCARVSYLTHAGVRDPMKDVELFEKLAYHKPPHASPLEHPAFAGNYIEGKRIRSNFSGWTQLRGQLGMNA